MMVAAAGSLTSTRSALACTDPSIPVTCSISTRVPMPATSTRPPSPAETGRPSTTSPETVASVRPVRPADGPTPACADIRSEAIETRPSSRVRPLAEIVPSAVAAAPPARAVTRTSTDPTEPPPAGRRPETPEERSIGPPDDAVTPPWAPPGRSAAYPWAWAEGGDAGAPRATAATVAMAARAARSGRRSLTRTSSRDESPPATQDLACFRRNWAHTRGLPPSEGVV